MLFHDIDQYSWITILFYTVLDASLCYVDKPRRNTQMMHRSNMLLRQRPISYSYAFRQNTTYHITCKMLSCTIPNYNSTFNFRYIRRKLRCEINPIARYLFEFYLFLACWFSAHAQWRHFTHPLLKRQGTILILCGNRTDSQQKRRTRLTNEHMCLRSSWKPL